MSKRSKSKYPALEKKYNLNIRKDYIETDYVDGVYDKDGNKVIRELNEEEKKFLNDYYEETIITNFLHDPELIKLNKERLDLINDDVVRSLKTTLKELKEDKDNNKERILEIKEIIKITKKQNEEKNEKRIKKIEKKMNDIRKDRLLYPDKEDHKTFYGLNNSRNRCLYNKLKNNNMIIDLEPNLFNNIVTSDKEDYETKLINKIERSAYEREEERLKQVLKEEKENKSKKNKKKS